MQKATDPLLVILLLVNFFMLGTSRLRALISGSAAQGVLLALLVIAIHGGVTWQAALIALGTVALKSIVIPSMLTRALRDAAIHREIEPVVGFVPTLLLGGLKIVRRSHHHHREDRPHPDAGGHSYRRSWRGAGDRRGL